MNGLVDIASSILSASERRLEVVSHNIANTATTGFKRQVTFSNLIANAQGVSSNMTAPQVFLDFAQGKIIATHNSLDLALGGQGFFKLRSGNDMFLSRQGQFQLNGDGYVVSPQGYFLQQLDGGDVQLKSTDVEILQNGVILESGLPTGKIGVYDVHNTDALEFVSGSMFLLKDVDISAASNPLVRQGMTEAANVNVAEEMVNMMAAIRQAEMGSRLVQVYDTLIGQAITTFGQGAR